MNLAAVLLADAPSDQDSGKQLAYSIVAVVVFIPIFWSMRRKVKAGTLAPNDRRTNPHSRTYLVVVASLNVLIGAGFLVGGVLSAVAGDLALGVSLLLLGVLISTFAWMIFRQGTSLRREGLPDRAPSEAQKRMSRRRRVVALGLGWTAGIVGFSTIGAAYDQHWSVAVVGAVAAVAAYGASWWLYRPLRSAEA